MNAAEKADQWYQQMVASRGSELRAALGRLPVSALERILGTVESDDDILVQQWTHTLVRGEDGVVRPAAVRKACGCLMMDGFIHDEDKLPDIFRISRGKSVTLGDGRRVKSFTSVLAYWYGLTENGIQPVTASRKVGQVAVKFDSWATVNDRSAVQDESDVEAGSNFKERRLVLRPSGREELHALIKDVISAKGQV